MIPISLESVCSKGEVSGFIIIPSKLCSITNADSASYEYIDIRLKKKKERKKKNDKKKLPKESQIDIPFGAGGQLRSQREGDLESC